MYVIYKVGRNRSQKMAFYSRQNVVPVLNQRLLLSYVCLCIRVREKPLFLSLWWLYSQSLLYHLFLSLWWLYCQSLLYHLFLSCVCVISIPVSWLMTCSVFCPSEASSRCNMAYISWYLLYVCKFSVWFLGETWDF